MSNCLPHESWHQIITYVCILATLQALHKYRCVVSFSLLSWMISLVHFDWLWCFASIYFIYSSIEMDQWNHSTQRFDFEYIQYKQHYRTYCFQFVCWTISNANHSYCMINVTINKSIINDTYFLHIWSLALWLTDKQGNSETTTFQLKLEKSWAVLK